MIDLSRIQNQPYTPMYAGVGYSRPKASQRDETFVHFYSQALNASQLIPSFPLLIDPDADFLWRGLVAAYQTGTGLIKLQFSDAWQNRLASAQVMQENFAGSVTPAPIYPEVFLPANTTVQVDILEYFAQSVTVLIALYGVKRFDCA